MRILECLNASICLDYQGIQCHNRRMIQGSTKIHKGDGLRRDICRLCSDVFGKKIVLVRDSSVPRSCVDELKAILHDHGHSVLVLGLAASDRIKSFKRFKKACDLILHWGIDRQTTIIVVGGGAVADLSGYVAASLLRGIAYIQIPTTAEAQNQPLTHGETGILEVDGENQIGRLHYPAAVIIDPETLDFQGE